MKKITKINNKTNKNQHINNPIKIGTKMKEKLVLWAFNQIITEAEKIMIKNH